MKRWVAPVKVKDGCRRLSNGMIVSVGAHLLLCCETCPAAIVLKVSGQVLLHNMLEEVFHEYYFHPAVIFSTTSTAPCYMCIAVQQFSFFSMVLHVLRFDATAYRKYGSAIIQWFPTLDLPIFGCQLLEATMAKDQQFCDRKNKEHQRMRLIATTQWSKTQDFVVSGNNEDSSRFIPL